MTFRVWPVLDLLADDRREEARERIETEMAGARPSPAAKALQQVLSRGASGGRPGPAGARTGTGDGERENPPAEDRAVIDVLTRIERASRALREGRVEELVAGALDLRVHAADLHPWIALHVASLLQSAFRFTGDGAVLDEAVEACTRVGDATGSPRMAVYGRALLGSLHMMSGGLHAALDRLDAALELARETGIDDTASAALAHQFRGYVLWERNRIVEAEAALSRAWERTSAADRGIRSGVARVLAMVSATRGRVPESNRWLEELEEIVREPMTLRNREWLAAVRLTQAVLVSRAAGRTSDECRAGIREVERWSRSWSYDAREVAGWSEDHLRTRLHELDHALTLLELTRQWATAEEIAGRVADAVGPHRRGYRIRARTARAVALENLGRPEEADGCWARALEDGAEEGFVRSYLEGSAVRARLHRRAMRNAETAELAARVCRDADGWPELRDHPELTPRQLDVLRVVAAGASNRDAARELDISVPTVKTHLRDILKRLGADSRTHAVAVARHRGLLE